MAMLGTLLLATFSGAGLTQAKSLNERANSYCSTNSKCSQSRQLSQATAYCVSALSIPKVTKTRTVTKCTTTTSTVLSYTSTITLPAASPVTSSICSCATPTGALKKRAQQQTVTKPSCFSALSDAKAVSSACSCLSIKNGGTTTTCTTTTKTKTVTTTKKTDTTINATPTTSYVFAAPSFAVANDAGTIWSFKGCTKDQQSGQDCGNRFTTDSTYEELLVSLNSANNLQDPDGNGVVAEVGPNSQFNQTYEVYYNTSPGDDNYAPLTCSISQAADGTCPLTCQVRAGDVNQGPTDDTPWYLGPPGAVDARTYKTYALPRGTNSGRGGCGGARRFRGRI